METTAQVGTDGLATTRTFDWGSLADLYLRPARFFRSALPLDDRRYLYTALLIGGIVGAQGRIDSNIMRAELGSPRAGWDTLEPMLMGSWPGYWLFSLTAGLVTALFIWYIGGWWYGLRIRWSGAPARDKRQARITYVWVGLVAALPGLLYVIISTMVFPDYGAAWASEELFSILLVIFPFWGAVVSYRAVRTQFPVKVWPARFWFLILPWFAFAVIFGGVGVLYALLAA